MWARLRSPSCCPSSSAVAEACSCWTASGSRSRSWPKPASRPGRDGWSGLPLDLPAPAVDVVHSRESLLLVGQDALSLAIQPSETTCALQYGATLNMPLLQGDSVVGVLFLAFDRQRSLGPDEMDLLRTIAPILAQALDRARLFEFQRSIASTLQRAMLTQPLIAPAAISVAARYVPAVADLSVGGDWYDVVQLDGDRVAIAVGDIVGRGINAQLRWASCAAR